MKGYRISYTFDDVVGIIVAPSAKVAKYKAYISAKDVLDNISIIQVRAHRAPEYDSVPGLDRYPTVIEVAEEKREKYLNTKV